MPSQLTQSEELALDSSERANRVLVRNARGHLPLEARAENVAREDHLGRQKDAHPVEATHRAQGDGGGQSVRLSKYVADTAETHGPGHLLGAVRRTTPFDDAPTQESSFRVVEIYGNDLLRVHSVSMVPKRTRAGEVPVAAGAERAMSLGSAYAPPLRSHRGAPEQ